jgi:hypothetical protein
MSTGLQMQYSIAAERDAESCHYGMRPPYVRYRSSLLHSFADVTAPMAPAMLSSPPKADCVVRSTLLAALGVLVLGLPASSQAPLQIECVHAATRAAMSCADTVSGAAALQTKQIAFRLLSSSGGPVADAKVRFFATSGRLTPDSTTTDPLGFAFTTWYRDRSSNRAVVSIDVKSNAGGGLQHLSITVSSPAVQYGLEIDDQTNLQTGFEKAPLRKPVFVQLLRFDAADSGMGTPVADPGVCSNYKVAFAEIGKGSISPDTAVMWYDDSSRECVAYGNWTLGEGAGLRDAKAALVGPNVRGSHGVAELEAFSRALPRIIGGAAVSRYKGFTGVKKGSALTARVERTLTDGTTVAYDTVLRATRDTVQEVSTEWRPAAIIGVSAPVVPSFHWLSLTAGVDLNSPTKDWYVGVSAIRPFGRLTSEALPVDVHALLHFGRSDIVANNILCATEGRCSTKSNTRWHGFAGMISVDASSLIAEVLKKFTP